MATFITMPKLGLTMTQGTITQWLKKEGDEVNAGDPVCEIETDKISAQVESPSDGVIFKILAAEFEEKEITAPLCVLVAKGEIWDGVLPQATAEVTEQSAHVQSPAETPAKEQPTRRQLVSPIARRLAEENGLDISMLTGTGPDGRIEKKDVESLLAQRSIAAPSARPGQEAAAAFITAAKRIPLTGPRKVAAERLAASKREIPHVYFRVSVDATQALALKQKMAAAAVAGRKPSLNDVIVKAAAMALKEYPEVNASFAGDEILCYGDINVGIAVDSEKGLFVPVIRQADKKSLQEITDAAGLLIARAREGKPAPDDLSGGTFTISNLGAYGVDEFAAIINPPQAAILAVGRAADTPVALDGEIRIRPMICLTLSVDHRVINGTLAARFLARLKSVLETPVQP